MPRFTKLEIANQQDLIFGRAPHPVTTRRGLVIGGGTVYPELNFTLPAIEVSDTTFPDIKTMYREIVENACTRAVELHAEGLVIEFETLIEMTLYPRYAIELTAIINDVLDSYHARHGLKGALRATPNDTRDKNRPPQMRSGKLVDDMLYTFEQCAKNGADMLAIESTGGKEIHDDAIISCDIEKSIFALAVLGARDMEFLWKQIVEIANKAKTIASGDTACGFGNTAMILADKHFIPRTFAAVVRVATIARSLVAYEQGAVGPGKDCGYENPFLKAITGFPMAMEGKSAACAHLSPVGNVALAAADLWSNESVQNVKLLGGMAPTISVEQLLYDCRLLNQARADKGDSQLRDWLARSDMYLDPQAFVLAPENVIPIALSVVEEKNAYCATKAACLKALRLMDAAFKAGKLAIPEMETAWIDMLGATISALPENEDDFIAKVLPTLDESKYRREDYLL